MIIDYLDIYNKQLNIPVTSKNHKRKIKLAQWRAEELRRCDVYSVDDISLLQY